jgi:hypothetical protein
MKSYVDGMKRGLEVAQAWERAALAARDKRVKEGKSLEGFQSQITMARNIIGELDSSIAFEESKLNVG